MKFEIMENNNVVMWCEHKSCIPNFDTLTHMYRNAGYRFRLNGKNISMKALKEALKEMPND